MTPDIRDLTRSTFDLIASGELPIPEHGPGQRFGPKNDLTVLPLPDGEGGPAVDECFAEARERMNGSSPRHGGELPRICANGRQLRDVADEALGALQAHNNPPVLFARGSTMVAVVSDAKKRQIITEVSESALRGRLTRTADYFKVSANGNEYDANPPIEVVRDILALPSARWGFKSLDAVVEAPVLRPDGSILDTPGYDAATQLYYAPDPDLRIPAVPEFPSPEQVRAAVDLLKLVIDDFPFVDQFSKANAIAGIVTPIVKPAINAPTPLELLDAPQAGTGKSLIGDLMSIIATGRPGEMFSQPQDDDEWRKQITMALMSGRSVVIIDNVMRRLDSGQLCKVLTETIHVDRAFRTHNELVLPVKCVFIATGNNISLGGDVPRRCYLVRIDAKMSDPHLRTNFKIENIKAWTTEHRGELLTAILTIARAWYIAGRPKPDVKPLGSFEAWTTTVGGILQHAGIDGFLANAAEMYQAADSESVQWEGFLQVLYEVFYGDAFTIAEVVEVMNGKTATHGLSEPSARAASLRAALPDFLAEYMDREGSFQRRAGKCFAERVGRRYGGSQVHLVRGEIAHKVQQWKVVLPVSPAQAENAKSNNSGG